jgi:uncharacterized membrane protein YozB (DUF420 family)
MMQAYLTMTSALRSLPATKPEYLPNNRGENLQALWVRVAGSRLSASEEVCVVEGFLGTHAGYGSDLNLTIQIAMGVALIFGAYLARAKRFVTHGICQTTVLVLNLAVICFVMWPSFHSHVLPRLPTRLGKRFYAVATIHGVFGVLAEVLGLYIVLVAGTEILPQKWRFKRLKLWMRIELALWWIVLLMGVVTYWVWFVG